MRDWLGKPLLILAAIVLVLSALSFWWLQEPTRAGASQGAMTSPYQQRLMRAIEEAESAR